MGKGERLQIIKHRHRRWLRSQGRPVILSAEERSTIERSFERGVAVEDIAAAHGLSRRQVQRQTLAAVMFGGVMSKSIKLSPQARRALESL